MLFFNNRKKLFLTVLICCTLVPSSSSAYFWRSWSKKHTTAAVITASTLGITALGYYIYTKYQEFNNTIQQLEKQKTTLDSQIHTLQEHNSQLTTKISQHTTQDQEKTQHITQLTTQIQEIQNQSQQAAVKIQQLEEQKKALDSQIHTLQERNNQLTAQISQHTTQNQEKTQHIIQLNAQIQEIQNQRQQAAVEIQQLKEQKKDLNSQIHTLQEHNDQLSAQISQHATQKIELFRHKRNDIITLFKSSCSKHYAALADFIKNAPEIVLTEACNNKESFIDMVITHDYWQQDENEKKNKIIQDLFDKLADAHIVFEKMMLEPTCEYVEHSKHTSCLLDNKKMTSMICQASQKKESSKLKCNKIRYKKNLAQKIQAKYTDEHIVTFAENFIDNFMQKKNIDEATLKWAYKKLLKAQKIHHKDLDKPIVLCMNKELYTLAAWLLDKMLPIKPNMPILNFSIVTPDQQQEQQHRTARKDYFHRIKCTYQTQLDELKNATKNHTIFEILDNPLKLKK